MSRSTAFLLVVVGILGLLAVNAGDRLFKVLTRYRLIWLVWRLSRTVFFAGWAAVFLLLAAGLSLLVVGAAGDAANWLFELLMHHRFVYLAAVFVGSLLYFFWWKGGYPWKED